MELTAEQLRDMAKSKIDDATWKELSREQKAQIQEYRKKSEDRSKGHNNPDKNDWSYYAIDEQTAKDYASIPYNVLAGADVAISLIAGMMENNTSLTVSAKTIFNPESIAVVNYIHNAGVTTTDDQGINMSSMQIYTAIRRKNSGAKNYEAADVGMYILAMDDIYTVYSEAQRMLQAANLYSLENLNFPNTLFNALGVDGQDLQDNIANYRGRLNLLGKKINAIAVPAYFKRFMRSAFVSSNIFADSSSVRGQFYVYRTRGYYTWSGTTSTKGTELIYHYFPRSLSAVNKFTVYLDAINEMINAIRQDTDAQTISGDVLKRFEDSGIYKVSTLTEDDVVSPIYDEDALNQIENAYTLHNYTAGQDFAAASLNYTQSSGGVIIWKPVEDFTFDELNRIYVKPDRYIFNSHKDNPDYKDNLEWSRLICVADVDFYADGATITVTGCGQELVTDFTVYNNKRGALRRNFSNVVNTVTDSDGNVLSTTGVSAVAWITQFDWHPLIYVFDYTTTTDPDGSSFVELSGVCEILGDLKKFTQIDAETIIKMDEAVAVASFWNEDLYKQQG